MSDKYICYAQIERYDFEHELSDDLQKEDVLMTFETQQDFNDYVDVEAEEGEQKDWRQQKHVQLSGGSILLPIHSQAVRRQGETEDTLEGWEDKVRDHFLNTTRVKSDENGKTKEFTGFQYALVKQ